MLVIFSLIVLILFAIALAPYIGAFFSGVIFVVSLVVTAPAIHIFVGRNIKERDHISDKLHEANEKMTPFTLYNNISDKKSKVYYY